MTWTSKSLQPSHEGSHSQLQHMSPKNAQDMSSNFGLNQSMVPRRCRGGSQGLPRRPSASRVGSLSPRPAKKLDPFASCLNASYQRQSGKNPNKKAKENEKQKVSKNAFSMNKSDCHQQFHCRSLTPDCRSCVVPKASVLIKRRCQSL